MRTTVVDALPDPTTGGTSTAWTYVVLGARREAPALRPEQPVEGLLWVLRGHVATIDGPQRVVHGRGTLLAYRRGGDLRWAAAAGTRVRWRAKEVGLAPGVAVRFPARRPAPSPGGDRSAARGPRVR